jgi:hypothetical protein
MYDPSNPGSVRGKAINFQLNFIDALTMGGNLNFNGGNDT